MARSRSSRSRKPRQSRSSPGPSLRSRSVQRLLPGLAGLVLLGLAGLVVPAGRAGEITATGGGLSLGTRVNGQMGGSCGAGDCAIGGGTKAGPNLFHRFAAFDTRGGIRSVLFDTQGQRHLVVGVVNPLGSFLDKSIGFSSPASLTWLSPGGIHLGGGVGFVNIPSLQLSTATGLRVGGGMFDVMRTTAAQAAQLSGEPPAGRAGLVSDRASLAAASLSANGDVTLSSGLLTVDHELLLDAQGGHVLLQGGQIRVPGGSVELAGKGVSVAAAAGVSVGGASGGGTIRAQTGSGALEVAGSLEARGEAPGAAGGRIELSGSTVALRGARLEASGPVGGGTVLVGGGVQGRDAAVHNAQTTLVDGASTIRADATDKGKGGTVVVWADRATQVDGAISARGGSQGGDGGFVETSGKQQLAVSRAPDASAPQGKGGTWLLDPTDVTINATGGALDGSNAFTSGPLNSIIGADVIKTALNVGSSVVISTGAGGNQAGDITVEAPITKTAGPDASLSLNAHNNIAINAGITSTAGKLGLTLTPDSDANGSGASTLASGVTLSLNGGTAVFNGTSSLAGTVNVGTLSATGGNTTLESSGTLTAAQVNLSGGTLAFNGAATTPSLTQTGGLLGGSGNLTLTGAGNTWSGGTWSGGGTVTLSEGASLTASGSEFGTSMNWRTLTINKGASATFVSDLMIENGEKIINNAGILTLLGAGSFSDYTSDIDLIGTFTLNNSGTLIKSDFGTYSLGIIDLNNTGTLNVQAGTLVVPNTLSQSGTIDLANGSTLFKVGDFSSQGTISGTGNIDLGGGTLTNEGTISPGGSNAAGTLAIFGNLTLTSSSLLEIDLGIPSGASIGGGLQNDRLDVFGYASLGGTLTASLASGYNPPDGTTADILTARSFGGSTTSLPDGNFTTTNLPPGFSGTKVTPGEASPRYRLTKTAPVPSCAVGVCWDGEAGDNLWSTATNWSSNNLPTSSDTAYLNLLSGASVLLDDVQSIAALFSDSNNSLNIVRGGFLTLIDSGLSSSIQGALKVEGGDLALNNASVAFRDVTLKAGTITGPAAVTVSSNLQQAADTTIRVDRLSATQTSGVMQLNGELIADSSGGFGGGGGGGPTLLSRAAFVSPGVGPVPPLTPAGLTLSALVGGLDIGGSLSSAAGLSLSGNGSPGVDNAYGIWLRPGASLTDAGALSLEGSGGGGPTNSQGHGVLVEGTITARAGLSINGQGGAGRDHNVGVVQAPGSTITVVRPSGLTISGRGAGTGGQNRGVELRGAVNVEGGEAGAGSGLVVTAIGSPQGRGSGNGGLLLDGASLSVRAPISLTGTGGQGTNNLEGVLLTGSSTSVNGAPILVSGSGGNAIAADPSGSVFGHSGVALLAGATLESYGEITITGIGSNWLGSAAARGFQSIGVDVDGATVRDLGSVGVTINGSGGSVPAGSPLAGSIGLAITNGGRVEAFNGDLQLTGTAGSNLAGEAHSIGAAVLWGAQLLAQDNASISINGSAQDGRAFGVILGSPFNPFGPTPEKASTLVEAWTGGITIIGSTTSTNPIARGVSLDSTYGSVRIRTGQDSEQVSSAPLTIRGTAPAAGIGLEAGENVGVGGDGTAGPISLTTGFGAGSPGGGDLVFAGFLEAAAPFTGAEGPTPSITVAAARNLRLYADVYNTTSNPLDLVLGAGLSGAGGDVSLITGTTWVDLSGGSVLLSGPSVTSPPLLRTQGFDLDLQWAGLLAGAIQHSGGTISVDGPLSFKSLDLGPTAVLSGPGGFSTGGTISGFGTVDVGGGNTLTSSGILAPGAAGTPATLTINGNLALTPTSQLLIDLEGGEGAFDKLVVNGYASLGGTLTASLASGYNPPDGTTADILTARSFGGSTTSLPDGNFTTTNLPPGFSGTKVSPPAAASPTYRLSKANGSSEVLPNPPLFPPAPIAPTPTPVSPPSAPTTSQPPTASPPPPPWGAGLLQLPTYPIFGVLQVDPITELLASGFSGSLSSADGGGSTSGRAGGTSTPPSSANTLRSAAAGGRGLLSFSSVSDLGWIFTGSDLQAPDSATPGSAGAAAAPAAPSRTTPSGPDFSRALRDARREGLNPAGPQDRDGATKDRLGMDLSDPAEAYRNAERKAPAIAEQLGLSKEKEDPVAPSSLSLQEWMQRNAAAVRRGGGKP